MNDQSLLSPKPESAAPLACSWSLPVSVTPKLQALVYDILPWRKTPESDARSVCYSTPRALSKHRRSGPPPSSSSSLVNKGTGWLGRMELFVGSLQVLTSLWTLSCDLAPHN